MSKDLLIGIDLGSHAFRMVAARPNPNVPDGLEILASYSLPAAGIRRGVIISHEDIARVLSALRAEIERQIEAPIGSAFVSVGGPHVGSQSSRGLVVVSRADNRIGRDDIRRVVEQAGATPIGQNIEVLGTLPREFVVDSERGVKDPEGMQGRRLEVEAVLVTTSTSHLKSLRQALSASDLDERDLLASPTASARGTLTPRQRELGVAVVDIGHGTTDIAVYEDGELLAASVIPIGGWHITNDIAIGLLCDVDTAEQVKHEYGVANAEKVPKREQIQLSTIDPEREGASFSRRELAEIIDARLEEIFGLVGEELKRMGRWRLLPGGVVLTGGTANIPGIVDLARKSFHLPVQLGYPTLTEAPREVASNFSYANVLGLILLSLDGSGKRRRHGGFTRGLKLPKVPATDVSSKLSRLFRSILP